MTIDPLAPLLAAVRRRLWGQRVAAAVRAASWASVAGAVFAAAAHALAGPLAPGAVAIGVAAVWAGCLAWAASGRPDDDECAWWADRHLGGATAYTTWLEHHRAAPAKVDPAALRRLDAWTATQVPQSLVRLTGLRGSPARTARPVLAMTVALALAFGALTLPAHHHAATAPRAAATPRPAADAAAESPSTPAPLAAKVSAQLTQRLREAAERPASAAAGPDRAGNDRPSRPEPGTPQAAGAPPESALAGTGASASAAATDSAAAATRLAAAGPGTGSGAGDAPDDAAAATPAPPPAADVASPAHAAVGLPRGSAERRADARLSAEYDAVRPLGPAGRGAAAAPAAAPPTSSDTADLTAGEAHYVQAWLRATAPGR